MKKGSNFIDTVAKNDCAVTQDPGNGNFYLLETVPGLIFRRLSESIQSTVAILYFRSLIEQRIQGRTEQLRDALGIHFQPRYQNLLTLIPCSQISRICGKSIGEGQRGVVYRGVWSRPAGIGLSGPENVPVALKSIKVQSPHDLHTFLIEVSNPPSSNNDEH